MTKLKEWNEFLENLLSNAANEYLDTKENKLSKQKLALLDAQMSKEYPEEKHPLVYEHVFEIVVNEERKTNLFISRALKIAFSC